jgi:hypothetical protein
LAHGLHDRLVARPDGFGQEHLTLVRQVDDSAALPLVGHKCLLHEARFALTQCLTGDIEMV